jgi:hypothetical protein
MADAHAITGLDAPRRAPGAVSRPGGNARLRARAATRGFGFAAEGDALRRSPSSPSSAKQPARMSAPSCELTCAWRIATRAQRERSCGISRKAALEELARRL